MHIHRFPQASGASRSFHIIIPVELFNRLLSSSPLIETTRTFRTTVDLIIGWSSGTAKNASKDEDDEGAFADDESGAKHSHDSSSERGSLDLVLKALHKCHDAKYPPLPTQQRADMNMEMLDYRARLAVWISARKDWRVLS
jgi:hypothetical protein